MRQKKRRKMTMQILILYLRRHRSVTASTSLGNYVDTNIEPSDERTTCICIDVSQMQSKFVYLHIIIGANVVVSNEECCSLHPLFLSYISSPFSLFIYNDYLHISMTSSFIIIENINKILKLFFLFIVFIFSSIKLMTLE